MWLMRCRDREHWEDDSEGRARWFGETRCTADGYLGVKTSRARSGRGNGDKK